MAKLFARASAKSTLAELVERAAEVESERRKLETIDGNLSASAYVAAAMAVEGADPKEVEVLEEALSKPQNLMLLSPFRRMCKAIADFKRSAPIRHYGGYIDDEAAAALGRLGATYASFFALCAKHMARERPELFGTMNSPNELAEKHAKLANERERLYEEIAKAWTRDDITVQPITDTDQQSGLSRITFNITNGEIALGDGRELGERLVNWLLSQEARAAAA